MASTSTNEIVEALRASVKDVERLKQQNGRLLALARHVGHAAIRFSRLTAPGAEAGRFREIPPAVGAH